MVLGDVDALDGVSRVVVAVADDELTIVLDVVDDEDSNSLVCTQ